MSASGDPPQRANVGPRNITAWSIDHPHLIIASALAVLLMALGIVFSGVLPRRMMPYVESPIVGVVTEMDGLSAEEFETYISRPMEERLANLPGSRSIRSTSQDGLSIVSIEFSYGSDRKQALLDVQSAVNAVAANLPRIGTGRPVPHVVPVDPLNMPVLSLSLTGDQTEGWTPVLLRQFAENQAAIALKQVPQVASVEVYGGQQRRLCVTVDRDRLAASGFSILDVREAIDGASIARPAGTLSEGPQENLVRMEARGRSVEEIADIPLGTKKGRAFLLRDVAEVTDGIREQRSGYHFVDNTHPPGRIEGLHNEAVELAIFQNPEASSPQVIGAVQERLKRLTADYPGLHFHTSFDNAHFVNTLFRNTGEELLIAVLLCGLTLLLFLGSRRATLIAMTTIPVSMAMAILWMVPFGFSLNSSTLIGLLLSIGRLVDDSVIDIHAIQRHLKLGKNVRSAAIEGITEVRRAVGASTFILALALVPLLFCGGITQAMFVGLVYPIIFGILASFLVSLTLTGVMAAYLMEPQSLLARPPVQQRGLLSMVRWHLDSLEARYEKSVLALLRRRFHVIAAAGCVILVGTGFYQLIGGEMMPLADVGQAYAMLEVEPGSSYAQTEKAAFALERILLRHPEIRQVSTEMGTEPNIASLTGYAMNRLNAATMMITLTDKDERQADVWKVIDRVRNEAADIGVRVSCLQIKEMGSDVMASSDAPIQVLVTGPNAAILSGLAEQVADIARKIPGMYQTATSWNVRKPVYRLKIDARLAAEWGLSPASIAEQAYYATGGGVLTESFPLPNLQESPIEVRYRADQRRNTNDLLALKLTAPDGRQVPLGRVAAIRREMAPTLLEHDGLKRAISVMAYYRKDGPPSMDLTMALLARASSELNFPPGYSLEVRGDMTQMMDSFARLLKGLGIAMVLIFLALIAQFRGIIAPLQMILSVPLELTGVFGGLYLMHQAFSSVSIMAVIVLTGMDITTAILLIDQIMRRRGTSGLTRNEAVALACRDRLRPILMTALITIVTMIPVAFFPRTGMDAYQPLGTVIVFGLLTGTLMSLFVIPVMHTLMDDFQRWIAAKYIRRSRRRSGAMEE